MGELKPSAEYNLPIEGLKRGQSATLAVSHLVEARSADRFEISLGSPDSYRLNLRLHYNRDQSVELDVDMLASLMERIRQYQERHNIRTPSPKHNVKFR